MKISHFPDFLPDETVFSVGSRYFDRMQFFSPTIVNQHFFGKHAMSVATDLPSNLEHLVQALPPHHIYTADTIIDHHTLFPLYAPFLPFERALSLRQRMKTDGTAVHSIAGVITNKVPRPQWLRYCPACVDNDRLIYGECYWHRVHQAPGVLVCPIHEVMLEDSDINVLLGTKFVPYCSAEHLMSNLPRRKVPSHLHAAFLQLASNTNWILEHSISTEQGYIQRQYLRLLADRGLVSALGRARYAKLKESVSDYYPTHLLENLECDIMQPKGNWLANWTTMQHPLHHLLFIQFLCETPQEFFTRPQHFSSPFDNGPWPCLNPFCLHYKERVITSYTVKQGNLKRPIATFACLCGFTYSRTGPDQDDDAIFRVGKITQFGEVWDQHLTTYWLDQNVSNLQIARLMHADYEAIRRQAARLDLPFAPDIPRRGKRPKVHQDYINERRDSYRALWEEALKAHPNSKITKLVNVALKAHSWLKRHDIEWLKEHCPTTDLSSENERLVLSKMQRQQSSYSLVDADLAKLVRTTAEVIYTRSDFPIQVTRQLLVTQIGNTVLLRKSNVAHTFLPLTAEALSEAVETYPAFLWRKLRWSVRIYLAERVSPSYQAFLSRARIGIDTSTRPIYKQLIQIAYCSLSSGTLLSEQMPEVRVETGNRVLSGGGNSESITYSSLEAICIDKQLMLPDMVARQTPLKVYDLVPILLITVAAVVNGAETCNAIANWSYQNEELLRWFGLPEDKFPNHSILVRTFAKLDIDSFESILGAWLCETFPHVRNVTNGIKGPTRGVYVPGIRLLRPYRNVASEVVARLR